MNLDASLGTLRGRPPRGFVAWEDRYEESYFFKKVVLVFVSIAGIVSAIVGIWIIFFGIDRRGWRRGLHLCLMLAISAILIWIGWVIQVLIPLPIILSEIVAVSSGFGVSAPCYGISEDARVVSIVVPEL